MAKHNAVPKAVVDLAQALFIQGLTYQAIAPKVGLKPDTVRQMAIRKGWQNTKDESKALLVQKNPQTPAIQAQSQRVRSKISSVIEADIDSIIQGKGHTLALKRQQRLEPLVRNAKVALGWGEEHTQVLVNISALDSVSPPLLIESTPLEGIPLRTPNAFGALGEGEAIASSDASIESGQSSPSTGS